MNVAHLHLLLNHVPVLGTIFGLVVFAIGHARKNTGLVRLSLIVFVLSGLIAGATYLTGEPAEDVVERMAGVSEAAIGTHENAAFYALIASVLLGVFALGSLLAFKERLPRSLAVTVMVLALVVSGLMTWTATLGGQINHPEIRSGAVAGKMENADPQPVPGSEDDDDDDD